MIALLLTLAMIFGELSLLAFGGTSALLPELQRQVVDIHQWMKADEFTSLFALAQASPGPNMLIVPLLGYRIAGLPGAAVAIVTTFLPTSLLLAYVLHLWRRFKDRPWRRYVQNGLAPVTIGLIGSSAFIITQTADQDIGLAAITLAATAATLAWKVSPLYLLGGGAIVGLGASFLM